VFGAASSYVVENPTGALLGVGAEPASRTRVTTLPQLAKLATSPIRCSSSASEARRALFLATLRALESGADASGLRHVQGRM